jgi:predicted ATPase
LRVFVSSTLGELAEERRAVSRAISALRLTPVMFELGARPYPPQEVYQQYLAQSDVFIGLYWQRYGQPAPGAQVSGLEEEFELSGGLPQLLYVKAPAPDRESRLAGLLARIQEEASTSYRHFRTPAELGRLVRDDLAVLLSERFTAGGADPAAPAQPPPAGVPRGPGRLPVSTTSLIGRERAIGEVAELLGRPGVRLVTLTGPGGVGKTRLAVAVGERLRDRFGAGTVLVPLEAITDPGLALAAIGRAAGADLAGTGSPLEALGRDVRRRRLAAGAGQPGAGSRGRRRPGRAAGPLPGAGDTGHQPHGAQVASRAGVPGAAAAPSGGSGQRLGRGDGGLAGGGAVRGPGPRGAARLRPDRGQRRGGGGDLPAPGGPALAIELAAARIRLLDPPALLDRLGSSLDALGTGAVDLPERQRTLRATVEWSVGLLEDPERSLLQVAAVFIGGWTIQALAQVAGLNEGRALELSEALARHSLVYLDSTELGSRMRMLETVREFVAERLAARPDVAEVGRRHAGYYRALAEQADRPLRSPGETEGRERLQAEAGNLAAAVRWYLAHDRGPLPHLIRVLWLFWTLEDLEREAWPWVQQLLPAAGTLDPQPRAELAWAAAALATDTGDDAAALAARQHLAPLLAGISDPFLHAVAQLAMAWTSPIAGDVDGALREAAASLEELGGPG